VYEYVRHPPSGGQLVSGYRGGSRLDDIKTGLLSSFYHSCLVVTDREARKTFRYRFAIGSDRAPTTGALRDCGATHILLPHRPAGSPGRHHRGDRERIGPQDGRPGAPEHRRADGPPGVDRAPLATPHYR